MIRLKIENEKLRERITELEKELEAMDRLAISRGEKIAELEAACIKYKKQIDFDMSTFGLTKKNALKYANSCKPNDLDSHSWSKSKERKRAYEGFIVGAKCEHAYFKNEITTLEKRNSDLQDQLYHESRKAPEVEYLLNHKIEKLVECVNMLIERCEGGIEANYWGMGKEYLAKDAIKNDGVLVRARDCLKSLGME
jgi:hypothetical protein